MSAGNFNFLIEQGGSTQKVFYNQDINGSSIPFPAGTSALFSIKAAPATITSANIILARSNDSRLTINLAAGTVTLSLFSNDTEVVLVGYTNLVYDLFLLFASGAVVKFLTGTVTLLPSVTHI